MFAKAMSWHQLKRRFRAGLDNDVSRDLARRVVSRMIDVEIFIARLLDLGASPLPRLPTNELTVIIKTLDRERDVRRLVGSIRRLHPDLPVIVVNDGQHLRPIPGAEILEMPHNTGISAGRNAALALIDTPFFLLLDDDFVFFRRTRVAASFAAIQANPDIDILGGRVVNLPDFSWHDYSRSRQQQGGPRPAYPPGTRLGGLPVYSKVPNFFIGRTEAVRRVGWNEELKVMEHQEFFDRAYGVLTTVYDERLRVLHARNPFDRSSPERQANMASSAAVLKRIRREARSAGRA